MGASIAYYTLATSLILKFPSLIFFSEINDTIKSVSLFWPCSIPAGHMARQGASAACWATRMRLLSGDSRFPGRVGASHSLSAARNSCPGVHGITAMFPAWAALDTTPNLGSGVLTALGFKSWLLPAAGVWTHFQLICVLIRKNKGWDLPCKALPRSLLHQISCLVEIIKHRPVHLNGLVTSISRRRK